MVSTMGIVRALCGAIVLGVPGLAAAQQDGPPTAPTPPPGVESEDRIVARGQDFDVRASEIVPLLLDRYAMARDGRELLKLLISSKLIALLAQEQGIEVTDADVAALWDELDQRARAAGETEGLEVQLMKSGLGIAEFRDYLRLTLLQEELTRRALGKKKDSVVTPDQQEIWLAQEMKERGVSWPAPPWADGVAARCGSIEITREEFGKTLLEKMSGVDLKETCWHVLLLKGIERRMPDLAPSARREAVNKEMARRRLRSETANETKGENRRRGVTVAPQRAVALAAPGLPDELGHFVLDQLQGRGRHSPPNLFEEALANVLAEVKNTPGDALLSSPGRATSEDGDAHRRFVASLCERGLEKERGHESGDIHVR